MFHFKGKGFPQFAQIYTPHQGLAGFNTKIICLPALLGWLTATLSFAFKSRLSCIYHNKCIICATTSTQGRRSWKQLPFHVGSKSPTNAPQPSDPPACKPEQQKQQAQQQDLPQPLDWSKAPSAHGAWPAPAAGPSVLRDHSPAPPLSAQLRGLCLTFPDPQPSHLHGPSQSWALCSGDFVVFVPDHLEWRCQVPQGSSITPSSVGAVPECLTAAFLHSTARNQVISPWSFGWKIRCKTKLSTVYVHNSQCIWIRACPWPLYAASDSH